MSAFYVPSGDGRYESTEHTRGPWSPDHQHAGPPAALLARELRRAGAIADGHLARVTFEILAPIPIAPVETAARVVRPGRRVELLEAELRVDGEPAMLARGWRLRREAMDLPTPPESEPLAPPETGDTRVEFPGKQAAGWHEAMDIRFVEGAFDQRGPAKAWFRIRGELVAGEAPDPLDHLFTAADAGNGISGLLDFAKFGFVNTDLTVYLHRVPEGDWVGLDSVTRLSGDAVGVAESVVHDARGPVGRALQTLIVTARQD
jgi:acyl-Coa thioesterase superfamily protein/acyl-CoA thioesterase superfamily protein